MSDSEQIKKVLPGNLSFPEQKKLFIKINKIKEKKKVSVKEACKEVNMDWHHYYTILKKIRKLDPNLAPARTYRKKTTTAIVKKEASSPTDFFQMPVNEPSRPVAVIMGNKDDLVEVFGAMKQVFGG